MKQAEQQKLRFNTKKADLMIENMVAQINDHYDRIIEGLKRAKNEKVQEAKGALMEMQADPEAGPQGTLPELPKPEVPFAPDAPDAPEGMPPEMGMQGMPMEGPPQGGPQGMPPQGMPPQGMPPQGTGMPQEGMPPQGLPPEMPMEGMPPEMPMQGMEQMRGDGSAGVIEELSTALDEVIPLIRMAPNGEQAVAQIEAQAEELIQAVQMEGLTPEIQEAIYQFMEQLDMQQQIFAGQAGMQMPQEGMPPQGMPPQGMPQDQGMPPEPALQPSGMGGGYAGGY